MDNTYDRKIGGQRDNKGENPRINYGPKSTGRGEGERREDLNLLGALNLQGEEDKREKGDGSMEP